MRRIPECVKVREYPKVVSNGKRRKIKPCTFTALDSGLIAANINSYLSISADEYELVSQVTPLDLLLRKERLEDDLSKEAVLVVRLVLFSPGKVSSRITGHITRGTVTVYLRGVGWAYKAINRTFEELRVMTRNF